MAPDAPDPRRLLAGEAGVPNRGSDCVVPRGREAFRRDLAERRAQSLQATSLVRDGGALRQDRRYEDLKCGHAFRPILHRIGPLEDRHRPPKGARVHGIATPRSRKSFQPLTKERTIVTMFRGRSRSRRVKYGSQFGPYGMYSATRWPAFTSSSFRGSRTPWSIANSNGVGCSRASSRARSISRPSWLATWKSWARSNNVSRWSRYARSISTRVGKAMSGLSLYAPFTSRTRMSRSRSRLRSSAVRRRFAWTQTPTRSYRARRSSPIPIVSSVVFEPSMSSHSTRPSAFVASRTGSIWARAYDRSISTPNCVGLRLTCPRIPWSRIAETSRRYSRVVASTGPLS